MSAAFDTWRTIPYDISIRNLNKHCRMTTKPIMTPHTHTEHSSEHGVSPAPPGNIKPAMVVMNRKR